MYCTQWWSRYVCDYIVLKCVMILLRNWKRMTLIVFLLKYFLYANLSIIYSFIKTLFNDDVISFYIFIPTRILSYWASVRTLICALECPQDFTLHSDHVCVCRLITQLPSLDILTPFAIHHLFLISLAWPQELIWSTRNFDWLIVYPWLAFVCNLCILWIIRGQVCTVWLLHQGVFHKLFQNIWIEFFALRWWYLRTNIM